METQTILAVAGALALACVHVLARQMRFLHGVPRSRFLSAAGGISVAYVFVHLLPELAGGQRAVDEEGLVGWLEHHVWLMALLGLAVFYGVEKHSLVSRERRRSRIGDDRTEGDAFWLSVASFAVYNMIIGYLLLSERLAEAEQLVLYVLAIGVHLVVNDFGLREHHGEAYDRAGRWLLAGAVLAGLGVGAAAELSEHAIALVLAFIGGGVVLNVFKEELPGERRARFLPFLLGAAAYAAVLQLI